MNNNKQKDSFWTSYSDLMTSLFFVMLVLFIICLIKVGIANKDLQEALAGANAEKEQLEKILQLDSIFAELSRNSTLEYSEEKKMFYAKDFVGIEIFKPNEAIIKDEWIGKVDSVGNDIEKLLQKLNNKSQFHYQMVIEGNAAIRWDMLKDKSYNPDNPDMYKLSYNRALALYNRWRNVGKHDFRKYNTEIIIAGSGFNGNNRDKKIEENNKRFVIQIIPKVGRPESNSDK